MVKVNESIFTIDPETISSDGTRIKHNFLLRKLIEAGERAMIEQRKIQDKASLDDVKEYMRLGHAGYLYRYRKLHDGEDPDTKVMIGFVRHAEKMEHGFIVRFFKGLIDALT